MENLTPDEERVIRIRIEQLRDAGFDISEHKCQDFIWSGIRQRGQRPRVDGPIIWIQETEVVRYVDLAPPIIPPPKGARDYSKKVVNPDGPCSVYLAYDSEDTLLYVGVTARGVWRARQHGYRSEWWPKMARQEWEHFDNRNDALDREAELIAERNPLYNKVRPSPDKPRPRRLV